MPADTAIAMDSAEDKQSRGQTPEANSGAKKIDLQPPPFSEVHDGPEYDKSTCTIELSNGTRAKGTLIQFNAASEVISIMEPRGVTPLDIDMGAVKYLRLEKPYQLSIGSAGTPGLNIDTDARSFKVHFKDKTELTGNTFGSRTDKNGIHLYEQTKVGRKWRYCTHLFIAHAAVDNHVIGGQIGEMLVSENQISQDVLDTALKDQQSERSRLVGEYLVTQKNYRQQ